MPSAILPNPAGSYGLPLPTTLVAGQTYMTNDGLYLSVWNGSGPSWFGSVVAVPAGDLSGLRAILASGANNLSVIGVMSTYSGSDVLQGTTHTFGVGANAPFFTPQRGVARCRVTGAVATGDVLTQSGTAGVLATNNALTAPTVNAAVAIALEPSTAADGVGTIRCRMVV